MPIYIAAGDILISFYFFFKFIPRHTIVAGHYGFTLDFRVSVRPGVRPSIRPSVLRFQMITRVNINGFSPNLVCALILWRSGLGLLMGKFRQILTVICPRHGNGEVLYLTCLFLLFICFILFIYFYLFSFFFQRKIRLGFLGRRLA